MKPTARRPAVDLNSVREAERRDALARERAHLASSRADETRLQRERLQGSAAGWVSTPTSEAIVATLHYAQVACDIALVYGGAGLGKTCSVRHYMAKSAHVFHVELSPATSGVRGCLEEVAIAVGVRHEGRGANAIHREVCRQFRGRRALLVLDEAHLLGYQALDQVRCLHDQGRVGIVLMGNEQVYSRMAGSDRAAYLDRLFSRVGKRLHLRRAADADSDALAIALGVEDAEARALLRTIAARPGALRAVDRVVSLALAYAEGAAETIGAEHIRAAWGDLGGS